MALPIVEAAKTLPAWAAAQVACRSWHGDSLCTSTAPLSRKSSAQQPFAWLDTRRSQPSTPRPATPVPSARSDCSEVDMCNRPVLADSWPMRPYHQRLSAATRSLAAPSVGPNRLMLQTSLTDSLRTPQKRRLQLLGWLPSIMDTPVISSLP